MLPIHENTLSLRWIAEYWSREIGGLRTTAEVHHELLAAFWRGELGVVGGDDRKIVDRATFLRWVALERDHPGFVLVDSPEEIPPKATMHPDGAVTVDLQTYIALPSDQSLWTDDIVGTACDELAKLSLEDYHDLLKPGVNALRSTRQNLASYCETSAFALPRFWFGSPTGGRHEFRSFGGRPSVMRQVEGEMRRRASRRILAPTLREEAKELRLWAEANIDAEKQIPQVGAIENALRRLYKKLRQNSCPDHQT
jgi:hypothetical protein